MPERSCFGCKKQKEWGCKATKSEAPIGTKGAAPGNDGKWWLWTDPARLPLTFDGEATYACPRQTFMNDGLSWRRIFLYYGAYKAGHLPQAGATMDQSNKAMEVFNILDAVNGEADAELSKPKTLPHALQAAAQQRGRPGR